MNKLYNEEIKERFLSEKYINEDTQKTIRNVFFNSYPEEYRLSKDLYDFDQYNISEVIKNMNPHTKSVAKSHGRLIRAYIEWAIDVGLRKSNLNPIDVISEEQYGTFINKNKKIHYSYDEFIELIEDKSLYNSSDKALLFMMWHGIIGEQFSQIKELKFSDVDFENKTIYVKERDYHVPVDDKCIEYLEKTRFEKTYYQYNSSIQDFTEKELLESPYVFRNIKSPRGQENESVKTNVIYKRIHTIKELLNRSYLTPNSIKQSGMLHMGYLLALDNNMILDYEQLAKIGDKYEYSQITTPEGFSYYNTHLLREFLSEGNLQDLYGVTIEVKKR
jgi:integrase